MQADTSSQAVSPFAGMPPMRVLLTGATGFIGGALVPALMQAGHGVVVLCRKPWQAIEKFPQRYGSAFQAVQHFSELAGLEPFHAIINLAGASIAGRPWTSSRREQLLQSRLGVTQNLVGWLKEVRHPPTCLMGASAVGYYGCRGTEPLTENDAPGQEFMAELCLKWEQAAQEAAGLGHRVVSLRLGVVLASKGGALQPMALPYRMGLGGPIATGQQIFSWVHRDDVLNAMAFLLARNQLEGAFNLTAPEPVPQAELARLMGLVLKRPVWLRTPAWVFQSSMGEMSRLFTHGQCVMPARLLKEGYSFRWPSLKPALEACLLGQ